MGLWAVIKLNQLKKGLQLASLPTLKNQKNGFENRYTWISFCWLPLKSSLCFPPLTCFFFPLQWWILFCCEGGFIAWSRKPGQTKHLSTWTGEKNVFFWGFTVFLGSPECRWFSTFFWSCNLYLSSTSFCIFSNFLSHLLIKTKILFLLCKIDFFF